MAIGQSVPQAKDILASGRKKRQLAILGLFTFACMISFFLLLVDFGGRGTVLNTPRIIALAMVIVLFAISFVLAEVYWAV